MTVPTEEVTDLTEAFNSILRADYISIDDLDQLKRLENYYIDFYNTIGSVLQKQDSFISGRRGTGKTALILRAYYECLKTISPRLRGEHNIFGNQKILPIFIDLSNCDEIFTSDEADHLTEIHFVRQIIASLKTQLEVMFDSKKLLIFKQENPALDDLEYIERVLVEGIALRYGKNAKIQTIEKIKNDAKVDAEVGQTLRIGSSMAKTEEQEKITESNQISGLNIQEFYNKVNEIRKKAGIDSIYVFVDEFSDLTPDAQKKFSVLLKKLLGSKISMFYKIGVITDRYDFGEKIIIGRDLFHIPLDLNEYVERYGGTVPAIKKMQEFVEKVISKRLETYCPERKFEEIFRIKKDDLCFRLSRESLGITRTLGLILQNAWIQSQTNQSSNEVGIMEINYGISCARKTYFKQFQGAVKKRAIPGFYMDMWSDLLQKANDEKKKYPDRPASHILIDPIRKEYLNILCENFLIHLLEESRTSKYGGKYNLYCFDFDICSENNIKFAEDKDEFTAARFIYDPVLSKYDAYFLSEKIRSFKCNKCNKIYNEEDIQKHKVKRCYECDEVLEEIIHKDLPKTLGNYAEVEIKILGTIGSLNEKDAMPAQDIADAVGCSRQKVSLWGSRVLLKKDLIKVKHKNDEKRNYYYDAE